MSQTLPNTSAMSVLDGREAVAKLSSTSFQNAWRKLYQDCPWASEFQSWEFLSTWYDVYSERYEPILVLETDKVEGRLIGLLALARNRTSSRIVVAGGGQAEYHGWLAISSNSGEFISQALTLLSDYCRSPLSFVNVLECLPRDWLVSKGALQSRCMTQRNPRPLLDVSDPEAIHKVLRKKSNKSRYNRLKKMGRLECAELSNNGEFRAAFDTIADIFDRRQKSHNGITVFNDPLNRRFPVEYAERHPNKIKVFTLNLDGRIIAALIGQVCRDALAIDIIAFDTDYEEYSPAKLLIYQAALELSCSQIRFLDLTPGGEWKTRFQTSCEPSTTITVYPSPWSAKWAKSKATLKSAAKQMLQIDRSTFQR